jgi:hypothetical protein
MKHRQKYNLTITVFLFISLIAIPLTVAAAEGEKTVEYETGFYYTVQKGDTLWDLSQKFSDTPWQWPELWKENKEIANPHRIYPGERIRLYRRRGAHGYGEVDDKQESTEDTLRLIKMIDFQYAAIERVGFIRKKPVVSQGTIFKVEGRMTMISTGDLIYIRPTKGAVLNPGDKFTIYRTLNPIKDHKTNTYIGIQHYLAGAVEITIKRPEFVLGRVAAAYRPIKVGDLLMPYKERLPQFKMQESPEGLRGNIIVSEEHESIFGENTVAFIDKGEQEGVMPGQLYWIFKQEQYRINPDDSADVTLTPVILGELMVLHTEANTATVMITDSRNAITAGAQIASPFKLD